MNEVVLGRRRCRLVQSYATGTHLPTPYLDASGRWRCHDCGMRLTGYLMARRTGTERRLRHHPRRVR